MVSLIVLLMTSGCQNSSASNKVLAHRFHMDIFKQGKLDVADEILSRDFVAHVPGLPPEFTNGPEGVKKWASALRSGLSDIQITHHETIAEGDKVVIRWTGSGIHTGEMFGIPASGKSVNQTGFDLFRIANGKIVEMWQEADYLGMMRQIGAIPSQ